MVRSEKRDAFLLRIWWEDAGARSGTREVWRAWVQHVHSGEEIYVHDLEALLAFIEQRVGRLRGTGDERYTGKDT